MTYNRPLPTMKNLKKLAAWDGPFPMKSYRLAIGADRYGFDENTLAFLKLFPHDEIFWSRDDFLRRCQDLVARLRTEGAMSATVSRSPQSWSLPGV